MNFFKLQFLLLFIFSFSIIEAQENDTLGQYSIEELMYKAQGSVRGEPQKAIVYSEYALVKSVKSERDTIISYFLIIQSEALRIQGKLDEALVKVLESKLISENLNFIALEIEIFTQMGNIYSDRGEYDKVIPNYNKALDLAEKSESEFSAMSVQYTIAYFKNSVGDYIEAIDILKSTRAKYKDVLFDGEELFEYRYHLLMGKIYVDTEQYDSAYYFVNYVNDRYQDKNDLFSGMFSHTSLSEIYAHKKDFRKADYHIKIADSMANVIGNKQTLMSVKYYRASLEFQKKNYQEAIEILENVSTLTKEKDLNYDEREKVYYLLAQSYKKTNEFDKASTAFEMYINEHERKNKNIAKLDSDFKKRELKDFQADFQLEIEELENENKFNRYYIQKLILGGLGVILLLLVALFWFFLQKKKNTEKFENLLVQINETKESNVIDTKDNVVSPKSSTDINDETTNMILSGLKKIEASEYYLNADCNSYNVAKKIKTNTSYLSKVINKEFDKNFNTYINDLRINYAVVKLKNDKRFRAYTISSIANELGYKSADSFTKYFKKHTGLLPSFYIKQLDLLSK